MRIAICDDDPLCREQVVAMVRDYIARKNEEIRYFVFHRGDALLDEVLRFGSFDIYLLDIIMPGMNGIQLGQQLRQLDTEGKILFLTTSPEYAIDSYRARAFDYLLKPVQPQRLFSALDEAARSISSRREKSLIVKKREQNVKVAFENILYAELVDRKITYHLVNGDSIESNTIRTSFSESIQELLSDSRFQLCAAGLAVNLYHITMTDNDTLFFRNGKKLYVGKRAGRNIRSAWSDFWLSEEDSI